MVQPANILSNLMRSSEEVLEAVLSMCGRSDLLVAKKVADSKRELRKMLMLLHEIESDRIRVAVDRISLSDVIRLRQGWACRSADVINAAIHSAFVKYPRDDDPDWSSHWIQPEDSAHLTKVAMLELEAAGYVIVKR